MNLLEELSAENKALQDEALSLLDPGNDRIQERARVLRELRIRFDAHHEVKERNLYSFFSLEGYEEVVVEYRSRVHNVAVLLDEISDLPKENSSTLEHTAEALVLEIHRLADWEKDVVFPQARLLIPQQNMEELGKRAEAEEHAFQQTRI